LGLRKRVRGADGRAELGIGWAAFSVFFGDGTEIETKQQGEKIGGRGTGDLKHLCESGTRNWVIFGLDVGDAENVGGVDAGAGIPGLDFFEIGNGFGVLAGKIERETCELSGFGVAGIFCSGALQCGDGVGIIAFAIVDDAEFAGEIFAVRIRFGNFRERGQGVVEFALIGELMNFFDGRRGRLR
jgi:hypothetical protein